MSGPKSVTSSVPLPAGRPGPPESRPPQPMQEPVTFQRWMKRLRAELDLTQEALADAVGCAPQTIRSFESGTRRPSRDLAERLAEVLQVPPEQQADFLRLARASISPAPAPTATTHQAVAPDEAPRTADTGRRPSQVDSTVVARPP